MSLGKIAEALSNTIGTFTGFVKKGKTGPYTHFEGKTNRIIPGNWRLSLPYSLKVEGVSAPAPGTNSPISGLYKLVGTPSGGGMFDEFFLPIAPQQLNQDEVFAISINPTQRGIVVEHNGVVFKDLTISGTTGQRINDFLSGYEAFHQLRNYLRSYAELKKDPNQSFAQLIFVNRKDNENLIVEPLKFSLQRNKSNPFLYNYLITFKVIGSKTTPNAGGILGNYFNSVDKIIEDVVDLIFRARNVLDRSRDFIKTFEREIVATVMEPIEALSLMLKSTKGLTLSLADVPNNIKTQLSNSTVKAFLDNAKKNKANGDSTLSQVTLTKNTDRESRYNTKSALNVLPLEAQSFLTLSPLSDSEKLLISNLITNTRNNSRTYYTELNTSIKEIRDNASEKFGLSNSEYDEFVGRDSKFSSDEIDDPDYLTPEKTQILQALFDLQTALTLILSTNDLFKADLTNYISDVESKYNNEIDILPANSVDEIIVQSDTSLENIAAEYLGDPNRWIDIAILNDLIYPYIDDDSTSTRVKKAGDKLLIPRQTQSSISNIPNTKNSNISSSLTETERNLGIDLKVNTSNLSFDFIMGNNNDFVLTYGGANAGQAIIIKTSLEKGDLIYHPTIGVGLRIGEKIRQGGDVRDDLINTILSDERFSNIKNLSFITEGNTIKISYDLMVKYLQTPIPVKFDV